MDQMKKIRLVSNSFYNTGLELARIRDLTGAVQYLQKCLNLNKYHIEARNLLGLIYYEMGERGRGRQTDRQADRQTVREAATLLV